MGDWCGAARMSTMVQCAGRRQLVPVAGNPDSSILVAIGLANVNYSLIKSQRNGRWLWWQRQRDQKPR